MILHTVNKSPFERNSLESCLKHALDGSAVLLFEDGVYGAIKGSSASGLVTDAMGRVTIYALTPDVKARGLSDKLIDGVKLVDYSGFVDLAVQHDKVQSWL
jgi:tRNA 2-thiouridine synthesizing protein B